MRPLLAAPLLVLLVAFALSNQQPVTLGLWPADVTWQCPLSIAVLVPAGVSFFLGALLLWFSAMAARRRAHRAEYAMRLLEAQVKELKARLAQPGMSQPGLPLASSRPVRAPSLLPSA
jgi:uncharacterized integral membrane protein